MKHEFIAREDVNRRSGDVLITAKAGETVTLSDRAAEIAATFGELEYKGLIPETEPEKEFGAQTEELSETYEVLIKLKRDLVVEKAQAVGIVVEKQTIKELAKLIIERRADLQLADMPAAATDDGENDAETDGTPKENLIDEESK